MKCYDQNDTVVEDLHCQTNKPDTERTCAEIAACPQWVIVNDYLSECSTECGVERTIQTRTVICDQDGALVDDRVCEDHLTEPKPESQRTCAETPSCGILQFKPII